MSNRKKRNTCFGCENLGKRNIAMGGRVAYCTATNAVVPQHFESDPPQITYWRIPMNCPLSAYLVVKSEDRAPKSDWKTESL